MIYLDNAATSFFKPPCVISAVNTALRFLSGNAGRGGHSLANRASLLVERTRQRTADFFGLGDASRVIFTHNCTDALNLAILGSLRGGHVVTTANEHNSVLRPLATLEAQGKIDMTVVAPDSSGTVGAVAVGRAMRKDTVMIVINHISNVTGAVAPIRELGQLARRQGALLLVDGAQSAGYTDIDMERDNIDLLAIAPHKGLHAIQGLGVLLIGERAHPSAIRFGGTGTQSDQLLQPTELPEALEAGTLPLPAIAALCSALGFCSTNVVPRRQKMVALQSELSHALRRLDGVEVFSHPNPSGIVSFRLQNLDSSEVTNILSEQYDICVRGGLHCAPLIHRHLGSADGGLVRVSIGIDTVFSDLTFFLQAVSEILSLT